MPEAIGRIRYSGPATETSLLSQLVEQINISYKNSDLINAMKTHDKVTSDFSNLSSNDINISPPLKSRIKEVRRKRPFLLLNTFVMIDHVRSDKEDDSAIQLEVFTRMH